MEVKIYYRDTDCGGVVYYSNYLDYFERARTEWMEQRGVSVKDLADKGIIFIVKKAGVDYKTPAKYGQTLEIDTIADNISGASLNFFYKIKEKHTRQMIVEGSTKMVCINDKLKPRRIPEDILEKLKIQ
jgi:acyl-CoA thioester hydrolase